MGQNSRTIFVHDGGAFNGFKAGSTMRVMRRRMYEVDVLLEYFVPAPRKPIGNDKE